MSEHDDNPYQPKSLKRLMDRSCPEWMEESRFANRQDLLNDHIHALEARVKELEAALLRIAEFPSADPDQAATLALEALQSSTSGEGELADPCDRCTELEKRLLRIQDQLSNDKPSLVMIRGEVEKALRAIDS